MTGPLPPLNLKLNPSWVQSLTRVRFQNGNELMKCSYIYGLGKWLENRLNSISQSIEFVRSWNLSSVPPNASPWITFQKNPHLWALCRIGLILVVFSVPILHCQRIQRTNLLLNYSLSGSATSQEAGLWRGRREKTGNSVGCGRPASRADPARMQLHVVTRWLNCFRLLSFLNILVFFCWKPTTPG